MGYFVQQDMLVYLGLILAFVFGLFVTGIYFLLRSKFGQGVDKDWKKEGQKLESRDQAIDRKASETKVAKKASFKDALESSRRSFWSHLSFSTQKDVSLSTMLEQIEEALYMGDLGPKTVAYLVDQAQKHFSHHELNEQSLRDFLKVEMINIFGDQRFSENVFEQLSENLPPQTRPIVLLIVGVNGAGKTTTIGKLAGNLAENGKKVLIAAGDTFRAAAESQLKVWTDRAQAEIFSPEGVKDPGAVAFDAVSKAQSKGFDVCIIDTAGRLHTQDNLMDELLKVKKVIHKVNPEAPHHTWLVLDANSGQNALFQAKSFNEKLQVSGVVLTKMDGTAKGGVALGVVNELKLPVRFVGIGEGAQDLRPFDQKEFVDSIV